MLIFYLVKNVPFSAGTAPPSDYFSGNIIDILNVMLDFITFNNRNYFAIIGTAVAIASNRIKM